MILFARVVNIWRVSMRVGGFRGGGGHSRLVPPPLLKKISINAPPFCTCAPPPLLKPKKKKEKKKGVWFCRAIPWLLLTPPRRRWRSGKKSVGVNPPPPAYQLFWDLREFRDWQRSEKKTVCCAPPPPFSNSWIRPCPCVSRSGGVRSRPYV